MNSGLYSLHPDQPAGRCCPHHYAVHEGGAALPPAEQPAADPAGQPPADRLSRLSAAMLRLNEGLDFDPVLQEVVDSARTLTSARYGAITVPGRAGAAAGLHRLPG